MNYTGCGDYINGPAMDRPPVLSVLYVDDEPFLLDVCKLYLERHPDISVSIASSVENALKLMDRVSYDVVVSDYQMPGTDGIGFLKILREKNCPVPFILFTCKGYEEVMKEAPWTSAFDYIGKGGNPRSQFRELEYQIRRAACGQKPAEEKFRENRAQSPVAL